MNKMNRLIFVILALLAVPAAGQGLKLTGFGGYTIQDKVYGYYGDVTIGDGAHYGGILSFEKSNYMSIDLTYSHQTTSFGVKAYPQGNYQPVYQGSVSYLMLGTTHSPDFSAKVSPYGGVMLGAAIFNAKEIISETWKFAVGLKIGAILHVNEKIGIVLQSQLMVPVQGIGVSVGCGSAGCGSGVATSSSATQLGFTGGLEIKLGN